MNWAQSGQTNDPIRAIAILLVEIFFMGMIAVAVKVLDGRVPLLQILFFRFVLALIFPAVMASRQGGISLLRTKRPVEHALRSVTGMMGLGFYFLAVSELPLADATALVSAAPLFVTIYAVPILGERVGRYRLFALGLGICGMLLVAGPGQGNGEISFVGAAAGILAALSAGFVPVFIRRMSNTEAPLTIALFHNATGTVVFLIASLFVGWETDLAVWDWALLAGLGLAGGVQQYLLALAYRYGEASMLAPFDYMALPIAAVLGFAIFSEVPTLVSLAGGAIIIAGGLITVWRERVRHIPPRPPRRTKLK